MTPPEVTPITITRRKFSCNPNASSNKGNPNVDAKIPNITINELLNEKRVMELVFFSAFLLAILTPSN